VKGYTVHREYEDIKDTYDRDHLQPVANDPCRKDHDWF